MIVARMGRLLAENDLRVFESRSVIAQARAYHAGAGPALTAIFGKAQINEPALRKIRIEHDVQEAALAARRDGGEPLDRLGQLAFRIHDTKPSRPFGHQHAAVGEKSETPGILQVACNGFDDHLDLVGAMAL